MERLLRHDEWENEMNSVRKLIRVAFICRGSLSDGLGHVMRSRTVALEMSRQIRVKFVIIGDSYIDSLISDRGLEYEIHSDEESAVKSVEEFKPHVIVYDLTHIGDCNFQLLAKDRMTTSLSPVFNRLADVNLFFNRTRYLGDDTINDPNGPEIRAGLQYTVVRENCNWIPTELYLDTLNKQPLSIVISMGGADANNRTLSVLNAIRSVNAPLLIWVLLGEGYGHSYEELVEAVKKDSQHEIILAKTRDSMWRIMSTCSLVILAGGTITYEAACAGIPSINIFDNEEHMFLVRELVEAGVCISAGFPLEDALSVVKSNLIYFENHRNILHQMHLKCRNLIPVDGKARVAKEIEEYYWDCFSSNSGKFRVLSE